MFLFKCTNIFFIVIISWSFIFNIPKQNILEPNSKSLFGYAAAYFLNLDKIWKGFQTRMASC